MMLPTGRDRVWYSVVPGRKRSDFGSLRHLQGVIDFDPQIPDGTLQFPVSEQELYGPEVFGPPVDQSRFCAPKRMGAVFVGVQSDQGNPCFDDPCILARG